MLSTLSGRHFHDEAAAYKFVEERVWPNGPICPHCGGFDRISKMGGKSTRIGTYKCYQCRKPFTVKVGTVFEASHVPLRHWLQAMFLLCSSKKGISANQLARTLGCTLKTGWFVGHRIREAMKTVGVEPLGGDGKTVEADETYFGMIPSDEIMPRVVGPGKKKIGKRAGISRPAYRAVFALVERGGKARTFHIAQADQNTVHAIMKANVDRETRIHTDESLIYKIVPWHFAKHETVKHRAKEYARGDVTTNSVEGYFSVFKRGMKGTYQHCAEKHLHRYLAEFDFRYNNRVALGVGDAARAELALKGVVGKRLTYKMPH
jgi:transposase-like protein